MRFNETTTGGNRNFAGGVGYTADDPRTHLYRLCVNNLIEDSYYETDEESLQRLQEAFEAAADENPVFPLQLAVYLREEMYLRLVPQVLLAMAAGHGEVRDDGRTMTGSRAVLKKYATSLGPAICQRADEPATVIAVWDTLNETGLPRPLKRTLEAALQGYREYELAKYRQENRDVSIYEVFNRVHPTPTSDEQATLWGRLMRAEYDDSVEPLRTTESTWEAIISEHGSNAESWRSAIPEMGLFARIRNARNVLEAGIPARELFGDVTHEWVENSKLYPFRFYQAWKAVEPVARSSDMQYLRNFFQDATTIACGNLPDGLEDTYVAVDLSGSMDQKISEHSTLTAKEIGVLFGAALHQQGADAGGFGSSHEFASFNLDAGVFDDFESIMALNDRVGHSTNGHLAVRDLIRGGMEYDRLVLLTDMQLWDSAPLHQEDSLHAAVRDYRENIRYAAVYTIDLAHYGHVTFPEDTPDVYELRGWTEKVFDYMKAVEAEDAIVEDISAIDISA